MAEPNGEDFARIIDYLDGRLTDEEMVALEVRLSEDPELAEAFESFEELEALRRRAAPAERRRGRLASLLRPLAAAAALLVLALLVKNLVAPEAKPEVDVTLLPTGATLAEYADLLGFEEGWVPVGNGLRSGMDPSEAPKPDEFLEASRRAEEARIRRVDPEDDVTTGRFLLSIAPDEDCYVLVVARDAAGITRRLHPAAGESGSVEGGRRHFLPSPPVELPAEGAPEDRVLFDAGFLVPRGAGTLSVLVAFREDRIDQTLLAELDAELQSGDWARLRVWLTDRGFGTTAVRVLEPR